MGRGLDMPGAFLAMLARDIVLKVQSNNVPSCVNPCLLFYSLDGHNMDNQ